MFCKGNLLPLFDLHRAVHLLLLIVSGSCEFLFDCQLLGSAHLLHKEILLWLALINVGCYNTMRKKLKASRIEYVLVIEFCWSRRGMELLRGRLLQYKDEYFDNKPCTSLRALWFAVPKEIQFYQWHINSCDNYQSVGQMMLSQGPVNVWKLWNSGFTSCSFPFNYLKGDIWLSELIVTNSFITNVAFQITVS